MEWMIHQLAQRAGITSRTLRHYDRIGLLAPSRVGANGYRYYDLSAVVRVQRILWMRRLGMSLSAIAEVLSDQVDEQDGLVAHIAAMENERDRLDQRIRSAREALSLMRTGAEPGMDVVLEGFNDRHKDDVVSRWGEEAFRASNEWWHGMSLKQQRAWRRDRDDLVNSWTEAWRRGASVVSDSAQSLAARHVAWLRGIPGTPTASGDRERAIEMVKGLGDTYVDDPRFAVTFGGRDGAAFVRDALRHYARTRM